jgi:hypothetical protein
MRDTGVVQDVEGGSGDRADHGDPDSGPRASDAEREQFCAMLERHFADGRLSDEEFSQRLDRALHARSLAELYELVADLPYLPAVEVTPVAHGRSGHSFRWWRR